MLRKKLRGIIGFDNGLAVCDDEPLSKTMLNYHFWDFVYIYIL